MFQFEKNRMEIKTIAVVSAGDSGRRIAYASSLGGFRTILEDISPSVLEQGISWIEEVLGQEVSRGEIGGAARDAALANLSTANSAEHASRDADLIIEAVPDEIEMKIELFTVFDKFAKPGAIFATTTASPSISELAAVTFCPERCIGMRFYADASRMRRLDLVRGRETSAETIAICYETGRRMVKKVSVWKEDHVMSAGGGD
jgi:3-hydroxybutyryl-CoA dehydrogenase